MFYENNNLIKSLKNLKKLDVAMPFKVPFDKNCYYYCYC